ncbi:ubiquinol-cytochrome c reductase iron-sulfur subunit [Nocardioides mesophilus]|uniref:Cytochrome bc1 complex Rieske iron-sulfur subunit n=1 Tax=Nocardioides mesophilus TaxID=433659 RepID=A0A7G9RGN1_9ACTN|nr:Rieske 2Fe-2S domain-containing protein [Nocardioides mesophilus]QNN54756.1 Rieske 2Fe-2S domain-containing protein [Nocardioides mesophilus]
MDEPIPNPGLHEHEPRPTDVEEAAAKRAERQIATMFGLSSVFAVLFVVCYFVFDIGDDWDSILGFGASTVTLGLTLGMALLLIGIAAIQWARKLMSDVEIVEMRHPAASPESDREQAIASFNAGVSDSGIGRRPLIRNSMIGALAALGLPAIVALRDLGPLPGDKLSKTVWAKGVRVVNDVSGIPIKPSDVVIGQLVNGEPGLFFQENEEGEPLFEGTELLQAKAKAAVIMVRMRPDEITPTKERENWGIDGILCYSKICTHVGCPISLWEQQTHHLLCPCHQSTFDLADNGKVVFGPAARPLPQLPLMLDDEGYIVAQSDFLEPVGPSYWERGE